MKGEGSLWTRIVSRASFPCILNHTIASINNYRFNIYILIRLVELNVDGVNVYEGIMPTYDLPIYLYYPVVSVLYIQ